MSPEATARPVSTEGSQARLVSQSWNSQEGQVGWNWKTRFKQKIHLENQEGQVGSELEKITKHLESHKGEHTREANGWYLVHLAPLTQYHPPISSLVRFDLLEEK